INDLPDDFKHGLSNLFVDDTHIITWGRTLDEVKTKTIENVRATKKWTEDNGLLQHPDKTKIMLLGSKKRIDKYGHFNLNYDGIYLENQKQMKVLGVTIDSSLTFDSHITYICKTVNSRIYTLSKLINYTSLSARKIIANACINSVLIYGIQVWAATSIKNIKIMEKLQ